MHTHRFSKGFTIVEIIVAAAIITTAAVAITGALQFFFQFSRQTSDKVQAALLIEEGAEALQMLRDIGWTTSIAPLSLGTEYNLYWNGSGYIATTTVTAINGKYRRTVELQAVERDGGSSITTSGTVDPKTLTATIRIRKAADNSLLATSDMLIHNTYDN